MSSASAIADAIAEGLVARHGGDRRSSEKNSTLDHGRTTDIAAAKAGLGSGKTYEAAKRVVEHGHPKLKWHNFV